MRSMVLKYVQAKKNRKDKLYAVITTSLKF